MVEYGNTKVCRWGKVLDRNNIIRFPNMDSGGVARYIYLSGGRDVVW